MKLFNYIIVQLVIATATYAKYVHGVYVAAYLHVNVLFHLAGLVVSKLFHYIGSYNQT